MITTNCLKLDHLTEAKQFPLLGEERAGQAGNTQTDSKAFWRRTTVEPVAPSGQLAFSF